MAQTKNNNAFLAEIYRGAKMGSESIKTLIDKTKNALLRRELLEQMKQYQDIEEKIYEELIVRGIKPKDVNPFQSSMAWVTVQFETMFNNKADNIATILMRGNFMGVIGITKSLNSHPNADETIKKFANDFINLIEKHNNNLKQFLR